MTETVFQSATGLAAGIRGGVVSSRAVTELLLAHIDATNPALNAIVELRREDALRAAERADAAVARGADLGPLHGVPMTIKDCFAVAGLPATWGNPAFRDHVGDWDATVVRRLRDAGAIILGRTNVPLMLGDSGQTANDVYGRTNNPWDLERSPGGSTGGGAAALAAGMTFLEYGSDLAGSIRIPASFCGVYGLKPSVGIVPLRGFQPPGPPAEPSELTRLSSAGPLARTAGDLRTALRVTAGPEGPVAKAHSWTLPAPRHTRLADFRVGVVTDHPHAPVSSEVGAVLSDAVDALAAAGARIVPGWPSGVDPVRAAESFAFQLGLFFAFHEGDAGFATLAEVVEQERRRLATRAAWTEYFDDVDVFLCPTSFTPAFPHDTRPFAERAIATPEGERPYHELGFWVSHASLPGLPAVSAPIGLTRGGLPVGAQIVGPLFEDDTAITFAELAGEVVGGFTSPPRA
ncbi:amidase [Solihabitans fulvus]|uniref:Amidase n=1 Tax=Solihabitans fulvus TaxID=1892852 RepID=A0A5B2WQU9_9PSEU|nr:amidase family protein [Solihabitans fulvus]KAA2253885.1 amidase [Solihabitans fulvus]